MNLVVLMGRIARDIELKETGSGLKIAKFTIALDGYKKDDDPEFVRCTAFGKTAEIIDQYLSQGDGIQVQGRIKTDTWEKDGEKKFSTGVIIDRFEFPPGKNSGSGSKSKAQKPKKKATVDVSSIDVDSSEIPF
jgi:single-strand DNA-binding protein